MSDGATATMQSNYVTSTSPRYRVGRVVNIEPYALKNVPRSCTGVKRLDIDSGLGFSVVLDGKRMKAKSLRVRHTEPMQVYGVRGMKSASVTEVVPEIVTDVETATGSDRIFEIIPDHSGFFGGSLAVTAFETSPLQQRFARTESMGVRKYPDPQSVIVDETEYINVGTVKVRGLRLGKVKLVV